MIKDLIARMKVFLNDEAQAETNLVDIKTTDGTILNYDGELAVGIEIFIVDETGKTPAPDGDYPLENGVLVVVADGKVSEIKEPEAPIETPVETPEVETPEIEIEMSSNDELLKRIESLEKENLSIKEILTQLAESFSKETFKEEVKMSLKENVVENLSRVEPQKPFNAMNTQLNSIFKNMYKK